MVAPEKQFCLAAFRLIFYIKAVIRKAANIGQFIDLTGQRFGRWTVVDRAPDRIFSGKRSTAWNCICDCGKEKIVKGASLKNGKSVSCGCYASELKGARIKKWHEENKPDVVRASERLHNIWKSMIQRCRNKNHKYYYYYGGRGITVCAEWETNYMSFRDWALDRIDNDKPYCPENCRFATPKEQANNRRNNRYVEIKGERRTIAEWSDILGFTHARIWNYVNKGIVGDELLDRLGVVYG